MFDSGGFGVRKMGLGSALYGMWVEEIGVVW